MSLAIERLRCLNDKKTRSTKPEPEGLSLNNWADDIQDVRNSFMRVQSTIDSIKLSFNKQRERIRECLKE